MNAFARTIAALFFCLLATQVMAESNINTNPQAQHLNYFQFQIQHYETHRQGGQILNVYVKYSLNPGLEQVKYPDYRELRKIVLTYLEPTPQLPENTYWEIIAQNIGDDLSNQFPINGVSVQLIVYPNETGAIFEPGFHGPIYTKGNITPLDVNPPFFFTPANQVQ